MTPAASTESKLEAVRRNFSFVALWRVCGMSMWIQISPL